MLVRDLIEWLNRFDPAAPVLLAGPDGLREPLTPEKATALLDLEGDWHVDRGQDEVEVGRRVDVVVMW